MPRPTRITFPGALYHLTARGDRREPIFVDNLDRNTLLDVLATGLGRFDAALLAYCLMGNHYHLVVQTRQPNLSQLMRHVNGVYTQRFNRRHGLVGHLFQGRFNGVLVDRQAYLLEVCRYVDLNPVRAGLVAHPADWPWSSYAAHAGHITPPDWLDSLGLWSMLLGQEISHPDHALRGASQYADLVQSAPDARLWDTGRRGQAVLGGDGFITQVQAQMDARMQARAQAAGERHQMPDSTAGAAPAGANLHHWLLSSSCREEAFWNAYRQGGCTMQRIGAQAKLSVQHVSRLIARWEVRRRGQGRPSSKANTQVET